ncbi:hypothetical protein BCR33DRAFT_714538 [Rhizoclosmatium globosum]|uniref:SAM domain-containing protein n=1 Tax=Rhizoclosmatium globosum TaxID=329046 RepID=A0A1Y2CM47_9FUNG|nr:hypothetical protein BCR33DRAFT_714538 [Rhizoclosmatium globosum]|eukprot:ORY48108.1 hypothetical protein BCR33DRAFT_714538 [Rhizoclosmatium globosum]
MSSIQRFEVVGTAENTRSDGAIVVEAGWDSEALLSGTVLLKVDAAIKNVRIQAEFRGYTETRWESSSNKKLAKRPESDSYKIARVGRAFQQQVEVIYDSPVSITPNPIGGALKFPFNFKLPKTSLPPSFETAAGTISYYVKCTILYQESMRLLKSNHEAEVPVIIRIPESAKQRLLESPSHLTHKVVGTDTQVGYACQLSRRVLTLGEQLDVDVSIFSLPKGSKLRSLNGSLRSQVQYINSEKVGAQAKFPRPLSELVQNFPLIQVNPSEPVVTRMRLLVDPALALASFESFLISVKTIFRLQVILDNSETPNIQYELPIVVVAPLKSMMTPMRQRMSDDPRTQYDSPRSMISLESASSHSSPAVAPQPFSILPEPRMPMPQGTLPILPPRNQSLNASHVEGSPRSQVEDSPRSQSHRHFSYLLSELEALEISTATGRISEPEMVDVEESYYTMLSADSVPEPSWTVENVAEWLTCLGAPHDIVDEFVLQTIDGAMLLSLSSDDLKNELGVVSLALRRKILRL